MEFLSNSQILPHIIIIHYVSLITSWYLPNSSSQYVQCTQFTLIEEDNDFFVLLVSIKYGPLILTDRYVDRFSSSSRSDEETRFSMVEEHFHESSVSNGVESWYNYLVELSICWYWRHTFQRFGPFHPSTIALVEDFGQILERQNPN